MQQMMMLKNVVENSKDDDKLDQLVENAEVCDGNDLGCDEGADNVIENVEDCVENDLEAGKDGFTVGDNGRMTSNKRTAEIVEGSINNQTAHIQQENVVSNSLKTYETPKRNTYHYLAQLVLIQLLLTKIHLLFGLFSVRYLCCDISGFLAFHFFQFNVEVNQCLNWALLGRPKIRLKSD